MKNILFLSMLVISTNSFAQVISVEKDSRQNFVINYKKNNSDTLFSGIWVPGDLVEAKITASVTRDSSIYSYLYIVNNQQYTPVDLHQFNIKLEMEPITIAPKNRWFSRFVKWQSLNKWSHKSGPPFGIEPGEEESFKFSSSGLPRIGSAQISNLTGMSFPAEEFEFPNSVELVLDSLKKLHGYIQKSTIVPYDPISEFGSESNFRPSIMLDTLETYRQRSCEELGWANDPQVCSRLEEDLNQVRSNLSAGDSLAAAGALQDFINLVQDEKEASLSSEGYALLFFNADYLADRLPEPEDEEPAGGFAIPELPAALTISSASASGAFSADNFSITGAGHDLSGSPDGGSAVHGIVTTTASARQGITGGLQSFQQDNITGSGSQPDVVQQNLSFDPQALIDSVLAGVQQTIPVNASGTFGSAQAPVILHAAQGIQSSATVTGTGILLIDGPFFVSGNFNWTGLVIHRGSPFSGPALSVSTSLQITGAMLTVNEGPWPASIQVSNIFELRYSGPALQLLRDSLTPQNPD